jgi:hypothetical protein
MVPVDVDFRNLHTPGILNGQFIQNRRQPLAVTSPGGIELGQDGTWKIENFFRKTRIRNFDRMIRKKTRQVHGRLALTADSPFSPPLSWNAVPRSAAGTANDNAIRVHNATPLL